LQKSGIMKRKTRYNIFYFGVLGCALIALTFLIKFDHFLKTPCRFVAQAEWKVIQNEPDKIFSVIKRNDSNMVQQFNLLQISRPDYIHYTINDTIYQTGLVKKGDIVARVYSFQDQILLAQLQGLRNVAQADVEVMTTGEKPAIREEAIQTLNHARAQFANFTPQYERVKQLYGQKLASDNEMDIAQATFDLYKVNVALAEARVKVVETGEKSAEIRKSQNELEDYENQIQVLEQKLRSQYITAPISGQVSESLLDSTVLCLVNKVDTMVVQIMLRENQLRYIRPDLPVKVYYNGFRGRVDSTRVLSIGNKAELIYGMPIYIAKARIANNSSDILPGMTGYVKIKAGKMDLVSLIKMEWDNYLLR